MASGSNTFHLIGLILTLYRVSPIILNGHRKEGTILFAKTGLADALCADYRTDAKTREREEDK